MYDSVSGRFVSRDPIGFQGSPWNLFEYVSSSPLQRTDPSGEAWGYIGAAVFAAMVACAKPQHDLAHSQYPNSSDKFKHCWVSCRISKSCGNAISLFAQLSKEAKDAAIATYCAARPGSPMCADNGGFMDILKDMQANQTCSSYWEQVLNPGPCGGWLSWVFRESFESCCGGL